MKTGAGAALLNGPRHARSPSRAPPREGSRPARHGQAARRPQAGRARGRRARAPARRGGRRGRHHASTRAARPCATRARPTTTSPSELVDELPVPVIVSGGHGRRRAHPLGVRAHRLRRGHARPRRARQPVAVRAGARRARRRADARGDPRRVALGRSTAPRSTSARSARARYLRKFHPWYVERLGAPQGASRTRCSAQTTLDEQRAVLRLPARYLIAPPAASSPVRLTRAVSVFRPAGLRSMQKDVILTPEGLEKLKRRSSTSPPRSAARSPSASRKRASSATSRRTPSTTTPRTSRRCSRRGSPRSRTSSAPRR